MKHIFFIFLVVQLSSLTTSAQDPNLKESMVRGKTLYQTNCAACHMAEGEGLSGVFPPLTVSDRLEDKNHLVHVILEGVNGPMEVNGVMYNGQMPGLSLSDREVADVLNYIRNSWGNAHEPITPTEVQDIRN